MSTIDWAAFGPAALGISLVPGANQLLSLRNAYREGPGPALVATLGRFAAFAVMVVLVGLGLGAVLARSSTVFAVVKWAGVTYLLLLGLQSLRSSCRSRTTDEEESTRTSTWTLTRREFTVAATNPKAVLLFAAMLPQFVHGGGSPAASLIAVGFAYIGVEACSVLAYTVVGSRLRGRTPTAARSRLLDRLTGTCLIGFAVHLGVGARTAG